MDWFILIIGALAMFCGGAAIGSKIEEGRQEQVRKKERAKEMRNYVKALKAEYERGYHDGFMKKVTPNNIREIFGLPPMEENDNVR